METALFELFTVVRVSDDSVLCVDECFPIEAEKLAQSMKIDRFCFPEYPCTTSTECNVVLDREPYSFSLQQSDGIRLYGFCMRVNKKECLCIISKNTWLSLFCEVLLVAEARRNLCPDTLCDFLRKLLEHPYPFPGEEFTVECATNCSSLDGRHVFHRPADSDRHIGDVHIDVIINSLSSSSIIDVFTALLEERRVVVHGKNIGSACAAVFSFAAMLYPFSWQHILIPILPTELLAYVSAPIPFLVGVSTANMEEVRKQPVDEIVFVDIDSGSVEGIDDIIRLPFRSKMEKKLSEESTIGSSGKCDVRRTLGVFMKLLVHVFGDYRNFMFKTGDFDHNAFLQSKSKNEMKFIQKFEHSQMFSIWLKQRAELIQRYGLSVPPSEFEYLCAKRVPPKYGIMSPKMKKGSVFSRLKAKIVEKTEEIVRKISTATSRRGDSLPRRNRSAEPVYALERESILRPEEETSGTVQEANVKRPRSEANFDEMPKAEFSDLLGSPTETIQMNLRAFGELHESVRPGDGMNDGVLLSIPDSGGGQDLLEFNPNDELLTFDGETHAQTHIKVEQTDGKAPDFEEYMVNQSEQHLSISEEDDLMSFGAESSISESTRDEGVNEEKETSVTGSVENIAEELDTAQTESEKDAVIAQEDTASGDDLMMTSVDEKEPEKVEEQEDVQVPIESDLVVEGESDIAPEKSISTSSTNQTDGDLLMHFEDFSISPPVESDEANTSSGVSQDVVNTEAELVTEFGETPETVVTTTVEVDDVSNEKLTMPEEDLMNFDLGVSITNETDVNVENNDIEISNEPTDPVSSDLTLGFDKEPAPEFASEPLGKDTVDFFVSDKEVNEVDSMASQNVVNVAGQFDDSFLDSVQTSSLTSEAVDFLSTPESRNTDLMVDDLFSMESTGTEPVGGDGYEMMTLGSLIKKKKSGGDAINNVADDDFDSLLLKNDQLDVPDISMSGSSTKVGGQSAFDMLDDFAGQVSEVNPDAIRATASCPNFSLDELLVTDEKKPEDSLFGAAMFDSGNDFIDFK